MRNPVLILPAFFLFFFASCGSDTGSSGSSSDAGGALYGTASTTTVKQMEEEVVDNSPQTMAEIETPYGNMTIRLYNNTPQHRDNFVKLANEGFYDDLLFHRVIKGFMIQGGDPDSKGAPIEKQLGQGGPGYTVPAEIKPGNWHFKGALAAARLGDQMNPQRNSSGSQFYVVHGNGPVQDAQLAGFDSRNSYSEAAKAQYREVGGTPGLDAMYTVFGMVVDGMEVIDAIAEAETQPGDRPVEDVKMKVRILEKKYQP